MNNPALNAVKHGLTATTVLLPSENPAAWQALLESLVDSFQPANHNEALLVEQMAAAQWRIRRAWSIESQTMQFEMMDQASPLARGASAITHTARAAVAFRNLNDETTALDNIGRQETRLAREYERALRQLIKLQDRRRLLEALTSSAGKTPQMHPPKAILQNEEPPR
ncbi:MAG: hypothetical protein U0Q16_29280 [Bryobacteraceae bacterium]